MNEIALYNTLRKIDGVSDDEAKEAVANVASSRDVATKIDITELKAETKADIAELKAETKVNIKDMATKADIAEVKADIAELKSETKADIAEVRTDIVELKADNKAMKWMLGLLLAINVAFILTAVGFMSRFV